jgi:hypothetical protein
MIPRHSTTPEPEGRHEWWVFSTCITDCTLMLSCRLTGAGGIVRNPTRAEWRKAFHAPSHPYIWNDNDRVEILSEVPS